MFPHGAQELQKNFIFQRMNQKIVLEPEYGIFLLKIIQYGAADKAKGGASLIKTDHVNETGRPCQLFRRARPMQI